MGKWGNNKSITFLILDGDNVRKCLAKIMPWVLKFRVLREEGFTNSWSYSYCLEKSADAKQLQERMSLFQEYIFADARVLEEKYPVESKWDGKKQSRIVRSWQFVLECEPSDSKISRVEKTSPFSVSKHVKRSLKNDFSSPSPPSLPPSQCFSPRIFITTTINKIVAIHHHPLSFHRQIQSVVRLFVGVVM